MHGRCMTYTGVPALFQQSCRLHPSAFVISQNFTKESIKISPIFQCCLGLDGSEGSCFPLILFHFYNRCYLLLQVFFYFQLLFFTSNFFIYFQPFFYFQLLFLLPTFFFSANFFFTFNIFSRPPKRLSCIMWVCVQMLQSRDGA